MLRLSSVQAVAGVVTMALRSFYLLLLLLLLMLLLSSSSSCQCCQAHRFAMSLLSSGSRWCGVYGFVLAGSPTLLSVPHLPRRNRPLVTDALSASPSARRCSLLLQHVHGGRYIHRIFRRLLPEGQLSLSPSNSNV